MSQEKARKEFEVWANTHYVLSELHWGFEDGEYVEPEMQYAWESWQASRAAVVVNLPSETRGMDSYEIRKANVRAIEAAGIKAAK